MVETHTTPTQTPVQPIPARTPGGLPGFEVRCSCGLAMANTIRTNVEQDARAHARWHQEKAR